MLNLNIAHILITGSITIGMTKQGITDALKRPFANQDMDYRVVVLCPTLCEKKNNDDIDGLMQNCSNSSALQISKLLHMN